jgi:hypothetical protein
MKEPLVTKHIVNMGVCALARETGLSAAAVSQKMKAGQTPDQIRRDAARRQGRAPSDKGGPRKPPSGKLPSRSRGPGRPPLASEYDLVIHGRERLDAIDDARLRRARALAERGELENALRRGELMPVSYFRTWGSRFLTDARDTLLAGPSELQDALALEQDPLKVAAILRAWLERVMGKFHQLERLWGADCEDHSS